MRSIVLATFLLGGATAASAAGLTEAPRLSAIYDTILGAQFDRAKQEIASACPPAPREACLGLTAAALWWEIQIDPTNHALDEDLARATTTAVEAAEAWTKREPDRAEAWFYLAGAYAPLTQWRVFNGQRLAAGRDGNRVRVALERATALDPNLNDAYFGIGLYHYYADVASLLSKFLRILLFLPGGDRVRGLEEMERTRDRGALLRGEADFQLHWIYVWYEREPEKALALLRGLDARYPSNPIFLQRIAEIERTERKDEHASIDAWQQLLARARAGRVSHANVIEARAKRALDRP